jgi:hypothetical protein
MERLTGRKVTGVETAFKMRLKEWKTDFYGQEIKNLNRTACSLSLLMKTA